MNPVARLLARRVTVAHSLPGRVRLTVPALTWVEDASIANAYLSELVAAFSGVTGAKANPVTGTLLVTYDHTTTTEAAVLDVVQQALDQAVRRADHVVALCPEDQRALVDRVREFVRSNTFAPGKRIEIPDDVWHGNTH